ncbi:MAG: PIN domain-containing protein [Patescibacteria group bacterium]
MNIVVDTCVLLDIFFKNRSRHSKAKKIGEYAIENNITITVTLFSIFEFSSGSKQERHNGSTEYKGINEKNALKLNALDINQEFFRKYFNAKLPYIKAGDCLLLSIAYKDKIPLITEDNHLYKKAKELNLEVYNIGEYIKKVNIG